MEEDKDRAGVTLLKRDTPELCLKCYSPQEMHVRAETLPRDCKMWATHAQENDKVRTIRKKKKKKHCSLTSTLPHIHIAGKIQEETVQCDVRTPHIGMWKRKRSLIRVETGKERCFPASLMVYVFFFPQYLRIIIYLFIFNFP